MTKGVKTAIIAIGIGGAIYIVYRLYKTVQAMQQNNPGMPTGTAIVNSVSTAATAVTTKNAGNGFPLKSGSRGDNVKLLQKKLGVVVDGIFGPKTQAALSSQFNGMKQVDSQAVLDSIINYIGGGKPIVTTGLSGATTNIQTSLTGGII